MLTEGTCNCKCLQKANGLVREKWDQTCVMKFYQNETQCVISDPYKMIVKAKKV